MRLIVYFPILLTASLPERCVLVPEVFRDSRPLTAEACDQLVVSFAQALSGWTIRADIHKSVAFLKDHRIKITEVEQALIRLTPYMQSITGKIKEPVVTDLFAEYREIFKDTRHKEIFWYAIGRLNQLTIEAIQETVLKLHMVHDRAAMTFKKFFKIHEHTPWVQAKYGHAFVADVPDAEFFRLTTARDIFSLTGIYSAGVKAFFNESELASDDLVDRVREIPIEFGPHLKSLCVSLKIGKACKALTARYEALNVPHAETLLEEVRQAEPKLHMEPYDMLTPYDPFELVYNIERKPAVVHEFERMGHTVGFLLSENTIETLASVETEFQACATWPTLERILRGHVDNVLPELQFALRHGYWVAMKACESGAERGKIREAILSREPITHEIYRDVLEKADPKMITYTILFRAGIHEAGAARINRHIPQDNACSKRIIDRCVICLNQPGVSHEIVRVCNRKPGREFQGHNLCRDCFEQLSGGPPRTINAMDAGWTPPGRHYKCPSCRDSVHV